MRADENEVVQPQLCQKSFRRIFICNNRSFFMLMLMHILGKDFIVWDKAAHIDFIKPSEGTVTARFLIGEDRIEKIIDKTADGQKYFPEFSVDIENEAGEKVAHVVKTLYIRKKNLT